MSDTSQTSDALDPLAPIEHFSLNRWAVVVYQQVSGSLAWRATRQTDALWERVERRLPVGFTVADASHDASLALVDADHVKLSPGDSYTQKVR